MILISAVDSDKRQQNQLKSHNIQQGVDWKMQVKLIFKLFTGSFDFIRSKNHFYMINDNAFIHLEVLVLNSHNRRRHRQFLLFSSSTSCMKAACVNTCQPRDVTSRKSKTLNKNTPPPLEAKPRDENVLKMVCTTLHVPDIWLRGVSS